MITISGYPGFGSPGVDGSIGTTGKSIFYSDYDLSNTKEFVKVQELIGESNHIMKPKNPNDKISKYARGYNVGDYILDNNNDLYIINKIDIPNNIVEIVKTQNSFNSNIFYEVNNDNIYTALNNILLQHNIPTTDKLSVFNNNFPLSIINNDGKLITLKSDNKDLSFNLSKDNKGITVDSDKIYMSNIYVSDNSNIIHNNSIFVILKNVINSLYINENGIWNCDNDKNANLKITELYNCGNKSEIDDNISSFEKIIKNYNSIIKNPFNSDAAYIKVYIKDNSNNEIFHLIKKSSIRNISLNNIKPITNISKLNVLGNIIDIKYNGENGYSLSMEFTGNILDNDITNINSEQLNISVNNNIVTISDECSSFNTVSENIIRSFDILGKKYYIVYSNPFFENKDTTIFNAVFNSYITNDAKYLQYNTVKNGIPCNAFMTVSSFDIKSVISKTDNIEFTVNLYYDEITPFLSNIFDESNKLSRLSAAIISPKNITDDISQYINIEVFNNDKTKLNKNVNYIAFDNIDNLQDKLKTLKNGEAILTLKGSISKDLLYIGEDSLKLLQHSPKLLILLEFDEPYLCDVHFKIKGNLIQSNYRTPVITFEDDIKTRIVPWELTGLTLKDKELLGNDYDVRLYNKVQHQYTPINLKTAKIDITNYNKRYFRFYQDDKSFYPNDITNLLLSDGVYSELSLLKYGYSYQNSTQELAIKPTKTTTHNSQEVNYSQFDEDIMYPVRTGININISSNDITKNTVYFNSVPSTGTKYAPTNIDGITAGISYLDYNKIYDNFDESIITMCEWTYNKTIKTKEKGNFVTYDCKLTNPFNTDLSIFATTDLLNDNKTENRYIPYSIFFNIEPRVVIKSPGEYLFNGVVNLLRLPKIADNRNNYYKKEELKDIFKWYVPTSVRTLTNDNELTYNIKK